MTDRILIQGSGGTIGDVFLSSYPLYNYLLANPSSKIYAAIPKNINDSIKDLYSRQKFLSGVIELESVQEDVFLKFCSEGSFIPALFLKSWQFYKNINSVPLCNWFDVPNEPTIGENTIVVHVASSSNYNRPEIPNLNTYINLIMEAGYSPLFIGTKKDEDLFLKMYPSIPNLVKDENLWRFGKDSLLGTMSIINASSGIFSFSSWSSIYGALCGKPVLELWNSDQWLFYSSTVKYLLGSPINLLQNGYNSPINFNYFKHSFPYVRSLCNA